MALNNRDIAAIIGIAALAFFLWRQHALGGIALSFIRIFISRPFI